MTLFKDGRLGDVYHRRALLLAQNQQQRAEIARAVSAWEKPLRLLGASLKTTRTLRPLLTTGLLSLFAGSSLGLVGKWGQRLLRGWQLLSMLRQKSS